MTDRHDTMTVCVKISCCILWQIVMTIWHNTKRKRKNFGRN